MSDSCLRWKNMTLHPLLSWITGSTGGGGVSLRGRRLGFRSPRGRTQAGDLSGLGQQRAEPVERPVQGDLDRVRALAEQLADLACSQVGAVAERDQLAV